jgi:23S rRNA (uracil1939-C5)-methyltransferase
MGHTKSALPFSIDQELTVTTEHMLFGNECIARVDYPDADHNSEKGVGKIAVFISGGAPAETAIVRITQVEKRFLRAQLVRVLEPSPGRVEPQCPVFSTCGGCQWQHLNYDTQIEEKKLVLERFIQKGLGLSAAPNTVLHKAHSPWNYRRRVQARYDRHGVGFFVEHTRTIAYTQTCAIAHPRHTSRVAKT